MKLIYITLLSIFVLLTACEKDEINSSVSSGENQYRLTCPSCMVTQINSNDGIETYKYDGQKRCIRQSSNHDSIVRTWTYSGSTILTTRTQQLTDGTIRAYTATDYLNEMGMIDSSVLVSTLGKLTTVNFYDSHGYLIRSLRRDSTGILFEGYSYQYSRGNQISNYILNIDTQGNITDSTLQSNSNYSTDKKNPLGEWSAWIYRTGRANSNEQIAPDGIIVTTTYSGQLPTRVDVDAGSWGIYFYNYIWNCN